jgi:ATP-binding cassette subfamily F protein 3
MEVKGLSFGFDDGSPPLISGLSFYVGKNDRIAIIGKNGKGKTTLLNLLAGELSSLGGTIRRHSCLELAYFGQTNINRLSLQNTVEKEITSAHPDHNRGVARSICGSMMFPGDQALKKISVLSGGERSRVLLGKLLVSPANMLLLDEPTNHLDMESTESLVEAIDEFSGAVIIVTHSEMILHAMATRLIVFDDEKVALFEGTYRDFLDRVGWKNENDAVQPKSAVNGTPAQTTNKKHIKRVRAELINEKSRMLRTLQAKIDEIESEIISLEEKTDRDNSDLLEASLAGDGETIKRLSKAIHGYKPRIESLFSEMELLHIELDSKTKAFEEKINSVGYNGVRLDY